MVTIGDIESGHAVGFKNRGRFVWSACSACGSERWVPFKKFGNECRPCAGKRTVLTAIVGNSKPRPYQSVRQSGDRNPMWKGGRSPEERRAYCRARYRANRQEYVARARMWALNNPEKARAQVLRKNHRRRGAALDAPGRQYVDILRADPCCYCGVRVASIEIDHIVPLHSGGTGSWENLTAACRSCNAAKAGRSLLAFVLERAIA